MIPLRRQVPRPAKAHPRNGAKVRFHLGVNVHGTRVVPRMLQHSALGQAGLRLLRLLIDDFLKHVPGLAGLPHGKVELTQFVGEFLIQRLQGQGLEQSALGFGMLSIAGLQVRQGYKRGAVLGMFIDLTGELQGAALVFRKAIALCGG